MSDFEKYAHADGTAGTKRQNDQFADAGIYATIVSSSTGPVNKTFFLKDGKIESRANANIYLGFAETVRVDTPEDLRQTIKRLGPHQAIALGRLEHPYAKVPLTTKAKLRSGAISRSKDHFEHSDGPGYVLADIDTKDLPSTTLEKMAGRTILEVLYEVMPELLETARLVRASSSAGITHPDGTERPATGYHIYLQLQDQSDSKALLQLMHDRLWEAAYGYILVDKGGRLHERSLIDTTVYGPERLIFEAAPQTQHPLTRRLIADQAFPGQPLKSITQGNCELIDSLKREAREAAQPNAQKAKRAHITRSTERLMKENGLSKIQAAKVVRQRLEGRELAETDSLEISKGRFVRVCEFLETAAGSVGMPCPMEGSEYGTSTAYYYPPDEYRPYPRIISFAHGGITEFTFARFKHLKGLRAAQKESRHV